MAERPKFLKVVGMKGCSYDTWCSARDRCDRVGLDVGIGRVPVDPKAEDLADAYDQAEQMAREQGNVHEPECTRPDNFKKGEPVIVFRVGSYTVERVY